MYDLSSHFLLHNHLRMNKIRISENVLTKQGRNKNASCRHYDGRRHHKISIHYMRLNSKKKKKLNRISFNIYTFPSCGQTDHFEHQ